MLENKETMIRFLETYRFTNRDCVLHTMMHKGSDEKV
jgi:hypothetical protein